MDKFPSHLDCPVCRKIYQKRFEERMRTLKDRIKIVDVNIWDVLEMTKKRYMKFVKDNKE